MEFRHDGGEHYLNFWVPLFLIYCVCLGDVIGRIFFCWFLLYVYVCVCFFFYSCDDQFDEHWTCTKKKNRIFLVGKCTIDYVDDFIDNQIECNVNWCGATHTIANAQDVLYFVESQHKVLVEFSTLPYDDITIVLFFLCRHACTV